MSRATIRVHDLLRPWILQRLRLFKGGSHVQRSSSGPVYIRLTQTLNAEVVPANPQPGGIKRRNELDEFRYIYNSRRHSPNQEPDSQNQGGIYLQRRT
ncbi:hypothetical protein WG66_002076 [Moniliophthora roreri]|nr:hypothetical protein WG66_002076 [Moniliophthora roreri]